jgi:hypothetical protein
VWTAENELWSEVMGLPLELNMPGCVCPTCFDKRCVAKGIAVRWKPEVDYRFDPKYLLGEVVR